jgi:murein DD-endopeptidase MepM/ murein hydrolase activator NlpD
MNSLSLVYTMFSYRKELTYVSFVFLIVILLTILGVILLTQTGIQAVSDTLVHVDTQTHKIKLFYPNGTEYKEIEASTTWPVTGVFTLEFGQSNFPYQVLHTGLDIANPEGKIGDPITPCMSGKVTYAGEIFWGYGKHVILDHGDNITSIYAHLSQIYVSKDQEVNPGDIIGTMGSTGWSTGPHLHFQINVFGVPVNPRVFFG